MKNKLIKDSSYLLISGIVQKGLAFAQNIILLNILGPAYQGIRVALQTYIDYATYANLGTIETLQKESIEKKSDHYNDIIGLILINSIIAIALTASISIIYISDTKIFTSLLIAGILALVINLTSVININLRKEEMYKEISIITLLQSIISIILAIFLTYYYGFSGFFIALLVSQSITLITYWYYSKRSYTISLRFKIIYNLIRKSIPMLLLGLSLILFYSLDRIIIFKFFGDSALGIYSVGIIIFSFIVFVNQTIWLPIINKLFQDKINADNFIKAQRLINMITIFTYLMFVYMTPFISIIFPKYKGSDIFVIILGMTGIFYPYINTFIYQKYYKELEGFRILTIMYIMSASIITLLTYIYQNIIISTISISVLYVANSIIYASYANRFVGISIKHSLKEYFIIICLVSFFLSIYYNLLNYGSNLATIISVILLLTSYLIIWKMHLKNLILSS